MSNRQYEIDKLIRTALSFYRQGENSRAEASLQEVIRLDPRNFHAHYFLGVIAGQAGRYDKAVEFFGSAIAIDPNRPEAHYDRGTALLALQQLEPALASYDKAVALNPGHLEAWFNRSSVLLELARFDQALASYDKLIALQPHNPAAHHDRGVALQSLDRFGEAVQSYDRAIALQPDYAEAHGNHGVALNALGRFEEALAAYDKAIALNPGDPEVWSNRGNALGSLDRLDDAVESYDRAIALKPDFDKGHGNRGIALAALGRFEEALAAYDRAIALNPGDPEVCSNRGSALMTLARFDDALASYDGAIALAPQHANAQYNRSVHRLLLGEFDEGLAGYEWRKRMKQPVGERMFAQPLWLGEADLAGRTILIHAEQGLGDTIQFARYIVLLRERGANILFAPQSSLKALMSSLAGNPAIVDIEDRSLVFDFHCPLLSLPLAFRTNLATIPGDVPYLSAETGRIAHWSEAIGRDGFRIGVCWQGSDNKGHVGRSFPASALRGIARIPGVRLISLQKGEGEDQLAHLPHGTIVETLGEGFDAGPDAFVDTAAAMHCCDLIITVDTAVAHLAGALGRPTWVALKRVPDWRWMLDRPDSPWYPTMKLFRQQLAGDWDPLFAEIEGELARLLPGRTRASSAGNPGTGRV